MTCATFALYTTSFTKSANQAISASESEDGDRGMARRWDILGKFETNFNHWYALVRMFTEALTYLTFRFKVNGESGCVG